MNEEEASSLGDISDLADAYFEDSSQEKETSHYSGLVRFSFDEASSNAASILDHSTLGGVDIEEEEHEESPVASSGGGRSLLNSGVKKICNSPGLLGVEGLDEESAAEMAEKQLMGLTRRDIDRDISNKKTNKEKPSPLKMYSAPFNSYFSQLLQEDGKSVTDSLLYSPSTYAVSVWKEQDDDISTIGSVTNCKTPDDLRLTKSDSDEKEVPSIKNTSSGKQSLHTTDTDDSQEHPHHSRRRSEDEPDGGTKRKLVAAFLSLLFVFLSSACLILALSLFRLQHKNQETTINDPLDVNPTYSPTMRTQAPTSSLPTNTATITNITTMIPIIVTTEAPPSIVANQLDLLQKITNSTPTSLQFLGDHSSPQYKSFEWLASDPGYLHYSASRIMQRWVLATFYLSTSFNRNRTTQRLRRRKRSLSTPSSSSWSSNLGWMTYTDECYWYSTQTTNSICNDEGMIVSIQLVNNSLVGTLPAELALLSGSLERLSLYNNNIEGSIPSSVGKMTNLKQLELGYNLLTGKLPTELRNATSLVSIELQVNRLDGTIPSELSSLATLEHLSLEFNYITGTVPSELSNISSLTEINLYGNELSGHIPSQICESLDLMRLTADCDEIECECCTQCCWECDNNQWSYPLNTTLGLPRTLSPTIAATPTQSPSFIPSDTPSLVPSLLPTDSPSIVPTVNPTSRPSPKPSAAASLSPTRQPSPSPTLLPSPSPSECQVEISMASSSRCYVRGVDTIEVEFRNCDPEDTDWVALFDNRVDPTNLYEQDAELWVRLCGDQTCDAKVEKGSIVLVFGDELLEESERQNWPLRKTGVYSIHLIRGSSAYATTEEFVLARNCQ